MLAAILLIHSVSVPGTTLEVKLATQVGRPYDEAVIRSDVRALWNLGRFQDIRVERFDSPDGADIVFHVTPEPQYALREIRVKPKPVGIEVSLPPGTMLDRARARQLATTVRRQLNEKAGRFASFSAFWNGTWQLGNSLRLRAEGPSEKPFPAARGL